MSKQEYFTDRTGKLVGSVTTESSGKKAYFDNKGAYAGTVDNNKTFDKTGKFYGNGDQGQRLFK